MTITLEVQPGIDRTVPGTQPPSGTVLSLVQELCQQLKQENVDYCHWKSNDMLERSASGENDLDLLINRAHASRFAGIMAGLGFKQVIPPPEKKMPGVLDYFALDEETGKWIHVHAHYQLIMGHDMTKNFRLPLEVPYLETARQGELFRVPSREFEYVVFVIRMVLKHSTWDAILGRDGRLKAGERRELAYLQSHIDADGVKGILGKYLPQLEPGLFGSCVESLRPGQAFWRRAIAAYRLQRSLQTDAVYPVAIDTFLKFWRRIGLALNRRLFKTSTRYRFQIGGALVAIVGGDGAGKSTAIEAVHGWLSSKFETRRLHMGKPAWSWTTLAVRSVLKIGQLAGLYPLEATFEETLRQKSRVSPGYPYLIREVCRARDRYWLYVKARRMAARGTIVILDRFPLPQIQIMDGALGDKFVRKLQEGPRAGQFLAPRPGSRFVRFLTRVEEHYYRQIAAPELLFVLRVPPHVAVERKTQEDPAAVERRSSEIWKLDWTGTGAFVLDAEKPRDEVASEIKLKIWTRL